MLKTGGCGSQRRKKNQGIPRPSRFAWLRGESLEKKVKLKKAVAFFSFTIKHESIAFHTPP